jgi:hypothetical protein
MKSYNVELVGAMPLLMHWDNIEGQDELQTWRTRPENKKLSVAGDDRSPAHTWKYSLYNDGEFVTMPFDNLRSCLMAAGKKVPKAKGKGTFKAEAVAGIVINTFHLPFYCNGNLIRWADVEAIEGDFRGHCEAVKKLGFRLFVKRAAVGQSKHVRVRPMFDKWSCRFDATVVDEQITETVLNDLFGIGGRYVGLGDWRPGSPKSPGPFGQFTTKIAGL